MTRHPTSDAVLDIFLGSSLGWLGLGAQPPLPEWGVIIADGYSFAPRCPNKRADCETNGPAWTIAAGGGGFACYHSVSL